MHWTPNFLKVLSVTVPVFFLLGCASTSSPPGTATKNTPISPGQARITIYRNKALMAPMWTVMDLSGTTNPAQMKVVAFLPTNYDWGVNVGQFGITGMERKLTWTKNEYDNVFPIPKKDEKGKTTLMPQADFEKFAHVFTGLHAGRLYPGQEVTYDRDPGTVDILLYNENVDKPHYFRELTVEAGKWYHLGAANHVSKVGRLTVEKVE